MIHKKGDKVYIKSLSWYTTNVDDTFGSVNVRLCFTKEMSKYCGRKAIIVAVYKSNYSLDIDDGEWNWGDEMFDDIKKLRRKKLKKIQNAV